MTASETWFYFPTVGVLGMLGVVLTVFRFRIQTSWILVIAIVVIALLGIRTAARGLDWRSQCVLAARDITASKENFIAEANLSTCYYLQHDFSEAKAHAERSVTVFPSANGYNSLGQALAALGDYPGAHDAFTNGIKYQNGYIVLYDNLAALTAGYGNPNQNEQFLQKSLKLFPSDSNLWMYLAVQEYRNNQVADAKMAITQAYTLNQSNTTIAAIYKVIMSNLPLNLSFSTY